MQDYPWWTDVQRELAKDAQKFTDEVLIPIGEKAVIKKEYPWEGVKAIAKKGWLGATIPSKYGGKQEEWGVTGACIVTEEASRAGAISAALSTALIGATHQILHDGTEEQKQRWLPKLATGELLGCITMTEPYVGSDIAAIETTGRREGNYYIVNGIKRFQTNAAAADLYMTYVKTSEDQDDRKKYRHLTGMILEKGMPGFSVERVNDWAGSEGMYNCYLRFDDVKVPIENVIGKEGEGWKVMMSGLNIERALGGASPLGLMRESIRYTKQHLERRVQSGRPTGTIATNHSKLADMYAKYQLCRLLVYYCAYCADLNREVPIEAALAKLYASEVALEVALDGIQCMGGNGLMKIYPVERYMRDAKLNQIAAGTSEVLRLLIYRMGSRVLAEDLKPHVRAFDEELGCPLPVGTPPAPKAPANERDVLKVLAEEYRINPGLSMTIEDMKIYLQCSDEDLMNYIQALEEKKLCQTWRNSRGQVELVRATLEGIKEANPPEYYKHIPSWVFPDDVF
ncbi:MAG: acyl-CoA/acyl-ACP dehydrogenase [Syntrophales bacterium]|jgi:alkylation response protein AidB-like acyl-CoA dehydrogenase|nr:acyl-CoA/acyl-ACP dehydrogenase [Syntrophales bacterium]MDY0045032.1 acyl-CoA dehydrogenase family protein [Syntrophales bacterium]